MAHRVKDPVPPLRRCKFDPRPGNFHMPQVWSKKTKQKRHPTPVFTFSRSTCLPCKHRHRPPFRTEPAGTRGTLGTDLVQEMPTLPAWPRSRRPLARFSAAMGHSALGASALSRSVTSTQQGAAGKARIWRRSFFRAATASLHLETKRRYWGLEGFTAGKCRNTSSITGQMVSGSKFSFFRQQIATYERNQACSQKMHDSK